MQSNYILENMNYYENIKYENINSRIGIQIALYVSVIEFCQISISF